jgi:hypothetical protein
MKKIICLLETTWGMNITVANSGEIKYNFASPFEGFLHGSWIPWQCLLVIFYWSREMAWIGLRQCRILGICVTKTCIPKWLSSTISHSCRDLSSFGVEFVTILRNKSKPACQDQHYETKLTLTLWEQPKHLLSSHKGVWSSQEFSKIWFL